MEFIKMKKTLLALALILVAVGLITCGSSKLRQHLIPFSIQINKQRFSYSPPATISIPPSAPFRAIYNDADKTITIVFTTTPQPPLTIYLNRTTPLTTHTKVFNRSIMIVHPTTHNVQYIYHPPHTTIEIEQYAGSYTKPEDMTPGFKDAILSFKTHPRKAESK
jgi:hypothetical protein